MTSFYDKNTFSYESMFIKVMEQFYFPPKSNQMKKITQNEQEIQENN
jgi:hypothetical protein